LGKRLLKVMTAAAGRLIRLPFTSSGFKWKEGRSHTTVLALDMDNARAFLQSAGWEQSVEKPDKKRSSSSSSKKKKKRKAAAA
jgi:hypothetical protein